MNWENPTFETLKKFESLIKLLKILNELSDPSRKSCRFSWNFYRGDMYIDGIPDSLGNLLSLLWTRTSNFSFYMFQENGNSMIQVLHH